MLSRQYEFSVGFETGTVPNPSTPTDDYDQVFLSFLTGSYSKKPQVTGTKGSPQSIVAGTGIVFAGILTDFEHIWFVQGSGGAVDVSANPQIAAGTAVGQSLKIIGCHDTNTVKLEHGTGLILNGECFLANGSVISLVWDGTNWNEVNRNGI